MREMKQLLKKLKHCSKWSIHVVIGRVGKVNQFG